MRAQILGVPATMTTPCWSVSFGTPPAVSNLADWTCKTRSERGTMARRLHLLCWHEDGDQEANRQKELRILADQYRLGVETQQHFTEMILRTRTLGMYGALLVMGSAMFLRSQYPGTKPLTQAVDLWSVHLALPFSLSAPALIACFGPALLAIVYLMDQRYYLKLLYGANTYVYRIERALTEAGATVAGVGQAFYQSHDIYMAFHPSSDGPPDPDLPPAKDKSRVYVDLCYILVGVAEGIVIWVLAANP
jgi:hypothetical protein